MGTLTMNVPPKTRFHLRHGGTRTCPMNEYSFNGRVLIVDRVR